MLRLFSKRSLAINSTNSLANTFTRCMSVAQNPRAEEQTRQRRERLTATLCGRIYEPPVPLESGSVVVPLATKNDHNEYVNKHRVIVSSGNLKKMFSVDNLEEGQRLYVSGVIGYSEFKSPEGYRKQSGWVLANEMFRCEGNAETYSDINEVKMFGHVQFNPTDAGGATFVEVSTQYFDAKEQITRKRLHQILIKDDEKMREQAAALQVGTGVFIHGYLRIERLRDQEGKTKQVYFITPNKLVVGQRKAVPENIDPTEM